MSSFSIAIYTHSDFFDILPIQIDYFLKHSFQGSKVYLFSDKPYASPFENILYDDTLPYASRLLHCIAKVSSSHILILHENDALILYDGSVMNTLIEKMTEHGIDSLEMKHGSNSSDPITVNEDISIGKKWEYFFCVQPTIWNRERLSALLDKFRDKSYRLIEQDDVQTYVRETYRTYITVHRNPLKSIWYRVPPYFCFLHLTSRLLLLPCSPANRLDPIVQGHHEQIFDRYLRDSKRKTQPTLYSFLSHAVKDHTW